MNILVAGGAGFIGCHVVNHYLSSGSTVCVLDNLCRGKESYVSSLQNQENLYFVNADLNDVQKTVKIIGDFHSKFHVDIVWHLAANSDIPAGISDASVDLRDTFMTTYAILQSMKIHNIKRIAFASSSAIYGDHGAQGVLSESTGPLFPISNYGAMKLASEALISAAVESYLEKAWIFRFPNVVGIPATHGVIVDFIRKLRSNPAVLHVLGNGTQQKSYLHVSELLKAMLTIVEKSCNSLNCYNIGPCDDGVSVKSIAEDVVFRVSPSAKIHYGVENKGWVGDVPQFKYCVNHLKQLGFAPKLTSREAVMRAIDEIACQEGL